MSLQCGRFNSNTMQCDKWQSNLYRESKLCALNIVIVQHPFNSVLNDCKCIHGKESLIPQNVQMFDSTPHYPIKKWPKSRTLVHTICWFCPVNRRYRLKEGGSPLIYRHMGVGQELTNGVKGVGHVFPFTLKLKNSPPPPHINNGRSLIRECPVFLTFSPIVFSTWLVQIFQILYTQLVLPLLPRIQNRITS